MCMYNVYVCICVFVLKATSDSILWAVDRFTFRRIVRDISEQTLNQNINFLKECDFLSALAESERRKLAEVKPDNPDNSDNPNNPGSYDF